LAGEGMGRKSDYARGLEWLESGIQLLGEIKASERLLIELNDLYEQLLKAQECIEKAPHREKA